jgi:hypothetical protein
MQSFFSMASSTIFFKGIALEPLIPTSEVMTYLDFEAEILADKASLENPAKTTEWTAPILAHARIVIGSCGIIGMYIVTTSPFLTP